MSRRGRNIAAGTGIPGADASGSRSSSSPSTLLSWAPFCSRPEILPGRARRRGVTATLGGPGHPGSSGRRSGCALGRAERLGEGPASYVSDPRAESTDTVRLPGRGGLCTWHASEETVCIASVQHKARARPSSPPAARSGAALTRRSVDLPVDQTVLFGSDLRALEATAPGALLLVSLGDARADLASPSTFSRPHAGIPGFGNGYLWATARAALS